MPSDTNIAPRPVVVIGRQRSGTTVFRQLLASRGAFDVGEVFHREFQNEPRRFFWKVQNTAMADPGAIHPIEYARIFGLFFDDIFRMAGRRVPAIDIKYNGLRMIDAGMIEGVPAAIRLCAARGAVFVHIKRENLLRVQISEAVAQATGRWGETNDDQTIPIEARQVTVDPRQILKHVETDTGRARSVSEWLANLPHKTVVYERMFAADGDFAPDTLAIATDLVGPERPELRSRKITLRRQNPEPLSDLVRNFDELRAEFSDTAYAWMLDG